MFCKRVPVTLRTVILTFAVPLATLGSLAAFGHAQEASAEKAEVLPRVGMSLALLAEPEVAQLLQLTDEQRSKVAGLLAERAAAMTMASDAGRLERLVASEQQLAAVLTEAQRARWDAWQEDQAKQKLRFNFRFQRYADVLDWLAGQAGLSLVVNAPPPGSFNYTDDQEYTPTEAIDLINGVLLTKGYTLIRRGRMLQVIDLSEEIPPDIVPRVTLEQLNDRGEFDLVSVLFPVENLSAEDVQKEITPLLGPYGKAVPLPQTKQILVTEMAGRVRAIRKVIQDIPRPKPEAPKPPPPEPEKPILVPYPIKSADPEAVVEILKALIPEPARFVRDPKLDQINAYATPTQQAAAKRLIDQMESDSPAEKKPRLQLYSVDAERANSLLQTLQEFVPEALMSLDPTGANLVVWGTPADQDTIQKALEQLEHGESGGGTRQLEVHQLTKQEPEALRTALEKLVPRALLAIDAETHSLIAVATAADQQKIKRAVDALSQGATPENTPLLEVYRLSKPIPSATLSSLKSLVPRAQIEMNLETGDLIAVAVPADQERVRQALEEVGRGTLPLNTPQLERHRLNNLDPISTVATLNKLVPRAQIQVDPKTNNLIAVATPDDQETIRKTIEQFTVGTTPEDTPVLEMHVLGKLDPPSTLTTIQGLVPRAQVQIDPKTGKLIAVATPSDQATIRTTLIQFRGVSAQDAPKLAVHSLGKLDPTSTLTMLKGLFTQAQLQTDPQTGNLIAVATPADQEEIRKTIEQLSQEIAPEEAPRLEIHRFANLDPASTLATSTLATLKNLVPRAQIQIDPKTGNLVAVASPADQETIRKTIEQFTAGTTPEDTPVLEMHVLGKLDPPSTLTTIQGLVPRAQVQIDPKTGKLIAVATPSDQATIRKTLIQFRGVSAQDAPTLAVHSLGKLDPTSTLTMLKGLFTQAQLQTDPQTGNLIAVATPADQEEIRKTIEQLSQEIAPEEAPRLEIHRFANLDPASTLATSTLATLKNLVPRAQTQIDPKTGNLVAVASPADQETIRKTIEQFTAGTTPEDTPVLEMHVLGKLDPPSTLTTIQGLVPRAQVQIDPKTGKLIAVATPSDQATIRKTLIQFRGVSAQDAPTLVVHPLGKLDPTAMQNTLKALLPEAQLQVDPKTGNLIAVARPADQETIRATLEQFRQGVAPKDTPQLEVHPLGTLDPAATMATLQSFVPRAQLQADAKRRSLVAVATPDDQQTIRAMLHELTSDKPDPAAPVLQFYALDQEAPPDLITLIGSLVPEAKVTPSADRKQLMVMALPRDHEDIGKTIDEFQKHGMVTPEQQLEIYPVTATQRKRLQAVLKDPGADLKDVRVITDGAPGELGIWARPAQHEQIAALLEKLKREIPPDEQYGVLGHTIRSVDPAKVASVLKELYPEPAKFEMDEKNRRLIIWARISDHAAIRQALQAMDSGEPVERYLPVTVYPITDIDPSTVLPLLTEVAPDAHLTVDPRARAIIATARASDHDLLKQMVEKINADTATVGRRVLAVYPCGRTEPQVLLGMLDLGLRNVSTIIPDEERESLLVWAEPSTQTAIRSALDQLTGQLPDVGELTSEVYRFHTADPRTVQSVLRTLFPKVKTEINAGDMSLVVSASAEEQTRIRATIEQMEPTRDALNAPVPYAHSITSDNPSALLTMLQQIFARKPEVQLSLDTENSRIIAIASPDDQQTIRTLLQELDSDEPHPKDPVLRFYSLEEEAPQSLLTLLATVAPQAKVTPSADGKQLMVMATTKDQEKISETITEFRAHGMAPTKRALRTYAVTPAQRKRFEAVQPGAAEELRDIRVITDAEPGELAVWATPDQHVLIAKLLEELKREVPPGEKYGLLIYTVRSFDPAKAVSVLQKLYPAPASFDLDERNQRLLIWARSSDHAAIRKSLETMDSGPPLGRHLPVEVYPVKTMDPQGLVGILQGIVPTAKLTVDDRARAVVAEARPADHELIRSLIEKLETDSVAADRRTLVVHPVGRSDPQAVMEMLDPDLQREAAIVPSKERGSLLVWANPDVQKVVRTALMQLQLQLPDVQWTSKVFRFRKADPTTVQSVLASLYPEAKTEVNPTDYSIVVSAAPEDLAKIEATIEQIEPMTRTAEAAGAPVARTYAAGAATPTILQQMIASVFARDPDVQVSADVANNQIVAVATPAQHETIARMVADMDKGREWTSTVYRFRTANPTTVQTVLRSLYPEAKTEVNMTDFSLVVTAGPEEQTKIKATIEQIEPAQDEANEPVARTYAAGAANAAILQQMIAKVFARDPEVQVTPDTSNNQIVAVATPAQHETIARMVADMDKGKEWTSTVYRFRTANPTTVQTVLRSLYPEAKTEVNMTDFSLVVTAGPEEQAKVKATIEQIEPAQDETNEPVAKTYAAGAANAAILQQMIAKVFARNPEVQVTPDATNNQIVAVATPAQHETIARMVADMDKGKEWTSTVYRFRTANPTTVQAVLKTLYPEAKAEVNMTDYSLVVTAGPEEQAKIKATIEQIEPAQDGANAPVVKGYAIGTANSAILQQMIAKVFARNPEVQVSPDIVNNKLMAVATPAQHETIRRLVDEMERASESAETLEVYRLESADATTIQQVLTTLFAKQPVQPTLSVERRENQLVAIATPEQHTVIRAAIERLQTEERDMEVFQLSVVDPDAAEMAIDNLFGFYFGGGGTNAPYVDSDPGTQQLYVRAEPKQLAQIREMLIKMGETSLTTGGVGGNRRRVRVIPFKGDTEAVVREIERMWKATHDNPIHTVPPSAVVPTLRQLSQPKETQAPTVEKAPPDSPDPKPGKSGTPPSRAAPGNEPGNDREGKKEPVDEDKAKKEPVAEEDGKKGEPAADEDKEKAPAGVNEAKKQPAAADAEKGEPAAADGEGEKSAATGQHGESSANGNAGWVFGLPARPHGSRPSSVGAYAGYFRTVSTGSDGGPPAATDSGGGASSATQAGRVESPAEANANGAPSAASSDGTPPAAAERQPATASDGGRLPLPAEPVDSAPAAAPVIVAAGSDSITIASEDLEVLDQMESLLRSLSESPVARDNNFQVYPLRNTDANEMARALGQLFNDRFVGRDYRAGKAIVVADTRTNAIVVRASRADRTTIEQMLEVLDAGTVPESLTQKKPTVLPLKNARAYEIEEVLKEIYTTQLRMGGGRTPIPVPSGLPEEVAAAIEQFNATATGPLLTLGVDPQTNALLISAPSRLIDEIRTLVTELDTAAAEAPAKSLKVIRLKKASATSIDRTLRQMIQDARRSGRRR